MKGILHVAVAAALLAAVGIPGGTGGQSPTAADLSALDDRGTFIISYAGHPVGTEKFSIQSSRNRVEAQAEINLRLEENGKSVQIHTFPKLVLSSQLLPLSYTWDEKSPDVYHLEVNFRISPARSVLKKPDGKDDIREFNFAPGLVILDDNVVHQYALLVRRYLSTPGGAQPFNAFIPQEALPGTLSVALVGREEADLGGKKRNLRHLLVSTDTLRVDLWVDDQGRLDRVLFPSAELEAVRNE